MELHKENYQQIKYAVPLECQKHYCDMLKKQITATVKM